MDDEETNPTVDGSRQLRARNKNRKFDDNTWLVMKDEDEGIAKVYYTSYGLPDKLKNPKYIDHGYVKEVNGYSFNIDYLDRNGLNWPTLIRNKYSLGLKVPDRNFTVNDVRKGVGSYRTVDVIDVHTQKNLQMSMKEYQKYYEGSDKVKLYNVISLEFSHTKLEDQVVQPSIVRKLDWVDLYWPKSLKSKQMDSTNTMKNMMYPKVQKYCLMSVKGCYTDFHVDFGGTSVWYHIVKGVKVFWLVPPTDDNLSLYRDWLLSDKQLDGNRYTFFGDVVDGCERVVLKRGQTFFIPSGWLHAVYTARDSIVFGGNFLHSYSIDMQIKISRVENDTRVTKKFRYPFFTEMHWYVLDGIFQRLMSVSDVTDRLQNNTTLLEYYNQLVNSDKRVNNINMSAAAKTFQLKNLKTILDYLKDLPDTRKNVPEGFHDHIAFLRNAEILYDCCKGVFVPCELSYGITSDIVVNDDVHIADSKICKRKSKFSDTGYANGDKTDVVKKLKTILISHGKIYRNHSYRRRRTRCRSCEACRNDDCGSCVYCKDMIKYGGNGRAKQSCFLRQCLRPVLPSNSVCALCRSGCNSLIVDETMDDCGRVASNDSPVNDASLLTTSSKSQRINLETFIDDNLLMECGICYEIAHPKCVFNTITDSDSVDIANIINNDLPNSWKCPKCYAVMQADEKFYNKQRFFKARSKVVSQYKSESIKSEDEAATPFDDDENKMALSNGVSLS